MPENSDFTGHNLPVFLTYVLVSCSSRQQMMDLIYMKKHIYKLLKICAIGNKEHLLKQILICNNYMIYRTPCPSLVWKEGVQFTIQGVGGSVFN
jgi:hypothetical protein